MINLIPAVKHMETYSNFFHKKAVFYEETGMDSRLLSALKKLPYSKTGAKLDICIAGQEGEGYALTINENDIYIKADGPAGAFYAAQTLRQIFQSAEIPCLYIKDFPDFEYRGFYHDVTRGKLPTLDTLKALADQMAYYKLNSLQLYIEHTLDLEEYKDVHPATGCYTKEEIQELDAYCKERFIDLIPSLSTFGHLYELLNQEKYRHLAIVKNYANPNVWYSRMRHHTIDPLHPESMGVIGHMIDQTVPAFSSPWLNICCDETFDLQEYETQGKDPGQLYVDFVEKIITHTKQAGKQVMMWADILLKHPETISQLPKDVCFLNWEYIADPLEEQIAALAKTGKAQIVCPGTTTWNRFCEGVDREESNICRMAEYGYKYGAKGVLNTNWGDYGNICSLELGMYGLVLGAAKSWTVTTQPNDGFYQQVNALLYEQEHAFAYLQELSRLHDTVNWLGFIRNYYALRYPQPQEAGVQTYEYRETVTAPVEEIQARSQDLINKLSAETWARDACRQEMLVAAQGICLVAELNCKLTNTPCVRTVDTRKWLEKYRALWLAKNKPQELYRIEDVLLDLETM